MAKQKEFDRGYSAGVAAVARSINAGKIKQAMAADGEALYTLNELQLRIILRGLAEMAVETATDEPQTGWVSRVSECIEHSIHNAARYSRGEAV